MKGWKDVVVDGDGGDHDSSVVDGLGRRRGSLFVDYQMDHVGRVVVMLRMSDGWITVKVLVLVKVLLVLLPGMIGRDIV